MWHMKKTLFYITIIFLQLSCVENKSIDEKDRKIAEPNITETSDFDLGNYVLNPKSTDTLCNKDIDRAKKDIQREKYVYVAPFIIAMKRYSSELKELYSQKGIEVDFELPNCVIEEGQTEGCYRAIMNSFLIKKLGVNFEQEFIKKADSLTTIRITNSDIPIISWNCDVEPEPILKNRSYLETTLDVENLDLKRTDKAKTWPAIDLNFIIEKDGTISKFWSHNYISRLEHNEKFKDDLYKIGVNYIKQNYPIWKAGRINNIPVRTEHHLRLTFIGK
ncbi:hypothetical protein SAMN05444278_1411 [Psychroflexus salarius]|uniref:Uncharacterized protein n=2 Tax=Psychroflexus salarius TaxID=1155689 RepID=A0A1M4YKG1_9FLAO|nr:hypothetical protein SAMN05444278_1411 [Psychroflexus salarius]